MKALLTIVLIIWGIETIAMTALALWVFEPRIRQWLTRKKKDTDK